jgi:hypothetical protein
MSVESVAIVVRACRERCRLSGREALARTVLVAVAVAGVVDCGRGCSGHGRAEKISADVLVTGVYLGPSVPDALGDNGKNHLGPRNEIKGS